MRHLALLIALLAHTSFCMAQGADLHTGRVPHHMAALRSAGVAFRPITLFHPLAATPERDALWNAALDAAVLLAPEPAAFARVLAERPSHVALDVPMGNGTVQLDLEEAHPFSEDFSVMVASTNEAFVPAAGIHYQGAVYGDPHSLVAISVFQDEVMGFVSTAQGEWTIGKLDGDVNGTHVLYRTDALRHPPLAVCYTPDDGQGYTHADLSVQGDGRTVKCVRAYWEVNYDIFQGKGSVANATNYVTGLFNQSQALYTNDGISVTLAQVLVWDVASPYTATSTSTLLDQFGAYRTAFNGDIAMLLGYAGGGGIAWLSGLCVSNIAHRMGYAGISSSYQTVPTYSWSVEVVTHEQGHILGSRHTHACAWNGNNTAIDGCGPTAGYSEGTCATGPLPSGGGTIMSYCHLVGGVGINFNNGFGPQPTAVIVNAINNASCLAACAGSGCSAPSGLQASGITTTGATLSWTAASGATGYTLQWKAASAGVWNTVNGITGTTYALSGLTAGTAYQFQVSTVCSGGSSVYSAIGTFTTTTNNTCSDNFEPNETNGGARTVGANSTNTARIGSATDVDWFKFANTSAQRNIKVTLTNLPANYNLRLYRGSGLLATSANSGTTNEQIIYNSSTVSSNYKVNVYGASGAFNASACYTLTVQISASAFMPEGEPTPLDNASEVAAEEGNIVIFPNPATDVLNVLIPSSEEATQVDVLDAMGRTVNSLAAQAVHAEQRIQLDIRTLPPGLYFVRAHRGTQERVQRFLVQR